ncbi:MAG: TonB family protein [Gemmatirosa sp.]
MLQLPESRRRSRRSTRGLITSVALHAVVIGAAAVGTVRATPAPTDAPIERVLYHAPPPAPRVPAPPVATSSRAAAPSIPSSPVPALPTPVTVPDVIAPPGPVTLPPDFFERRTLGAPPAGEGAPGGIPGGTGTAPADGIWASHLVEREVVPLGGSAPRYPEALRGANVEGEVTAEFVVDSTGRVEPSTVAIVQRAHPLFEQSVRQALRGMRFRPAQAGGRTVRQLVRQPFVFALQR